MHTNECIVLISNSASAICHRPIWGPGAELSLIKPNFYERLSLSCRTLGHLSAVYCVLFDMTGKHIITVRIDCALFCMASTNFLKIIYVLTQFHCIGSGRFPRKNMECSRWPFTSHLERSHRRNHRLGD